MSQVSVKLWVATRPETGETFVVPTDAEIDEQRKIETAGLDQLLDSRKGSGEKAETSARARSNAMAEMDSRYKHWLANCKAARQYARETPFELTKPTFGDVRRAYSDAQHIDFDNAQAVLDSAEYRTKLFIAAIGSEEKADALDPAVAQELQARVFRMVHPDSKRLPFVCGPPSK